MSTIKLPPLPAPLRARIFDGMASVYSPDQLRARDREVAKCVLEAVASWMEHDEYGGWLVDEIRSLEFKHAE